METKNIMIVGVGGQGTLLTSRILGGMTRAAGYDVKISEVHGMAQRGGSVVTYVRYGEKVAEPIVEEGQADVLIAFEKLEALRYAHFLKKDGVMIVNDQRMDPMTVVVGLAEYPENIIETLKEKHDVELKADWEKILSKKDLDLLEALSLLSFIQRQDYWDYEHMPLSYALFDGTIDNILESIENHIDKENIEFLEIFVKE